MSCDFLALAKSGVQHLMPYQPGKPIDELERELGITDIVKLASNENPLGLSPKVKALLSDNLDELTRYPDGAAFELRAKVAATHGVAAEQLVFGNGSNDVLDLIGMCFLNPDVSAIYSDHAFVVYPLMVKAQGARAIEVPAKDWGHDLDAMLAAIEPDTRVIFIANPNNPTGTWLGHAEVERFLKQVPDDVIVVLDEAYSEYIHSVDYANGIALLKQFDNLIVTRTFSKAYGLAGLRVGCSISSVAMAGIINRVRAPFNVNTLAQLAATCVLDDSEYLQQSIAVNDTGRQQLEAGLSALGYDFIPSQGNFISFDTRTDANAVYQALLEKGVIVRPVGPYKMPGFLRVSIGLEAENQRFLDALTALAD
ncbi:Histidinol-phosphate aminotransferase [BD1-7 clade bacterium]|uniref:Histidinol-phosphate aminotransferase n=1 Tax=BD1-7 clade bacterium TaxID=2029982 RepID=A0A5S9PUV6_9GAMM|nr:Histidinol-phosphate aminotransferase [BD1-7 clade bacterium]CAA0108279.1 Histidinol-phosphate aminotransferase [BD1-7 clade bacterium]